MFTYVFGYYANDLERYGIVEFDKQGQAISLEEKPRQPKPNYAIPGLYFYDNNVIDIAKRIKPSYRGELNVKILGRGFAWLDIGTHDSLLEANNYVHARQKRQGLCIACIEEIAYRNGYISKKELRKLAEPLLKTDYGDYLISVD